MKNESIHYETSFRKKSPKSKKSSVCIAPTNKVELIAEGTPFWEAQVFEDRTVLYRLNFNFTAKDGKNFNCGTNWESFSAAISASAKNAVNDNFSKLPSRDDYEAVQYYIGKKNNDVVNLDIKISSSAKVNIRNPQGRMTPKPATIISMDIHIHNVGKYPKIDCTNFDVVSQCAKKIPEQMVLLDNLMRFTNEIKNDSRIFTDNKITCFLSMIDTSTEIMQQEMSVLASQMQANGSLLTGDRFFDPDHKVPDNWEDLVEEHNEENCPGK